MSLNYNNNTIDDDTRAPYWLVDGVIEYVFNTLQVLPCVNLREIKDNDDLINHIQNIIANFERFIYRVFSSCWVYLVIIVCLRFNNNLY